MNLDALKRANAIRRGEVAPSEGERASMKVVAGMTHVNNLVEIAYAIARDAHEGQVDKSGEAYIFHPVAVSNILRDQGGTPYIRAIALLHDVLEDSDYTADMLLAHGLPMELVDAVVALTHRKGQSRADYREQVKANMDAVIVKLADIKHNMSRLNNLDDKTHKRLLKKYTEDLIFFGVLPESAREML